MIFESISNWIPALTTSTLLGFTLWLGKNLIITRLKSSVQHEFDVKIESLRYESTKTLENLKSQLREKETEISVIQTSILNNRNLRQAEVQKRRLIAIDQLWTSFQSFAPGIQLAVAMSSIDYEKALKASESSPRTKVVFEDLSRLFKTDGFDFASANKARVFLTPMVWAIYRAYNTIIADAQLKLHLLKSNIPSTVMTTNEDNIKSIILIALPDAADSLSCISSTGYHIFLSSLENKLVNELSKMIDGSEADNTNVHVSRALLEAIQAVDATRENILQSQISVS